MNEHAIKLQTKTLATAYRARTEWSLAEITDLLELKESGFDMSDIAVYLNRSYYAVTSMLHVVTSDSDAEVRVRPINSIRTHAQSIQARPACESCWTIHPGEC